MKLVVVTKPEFFVVEHLLIRELFNEGLDILHLRKSSGDLAQWERLLALLPENCRKKIAVHDNFELKNKYGLMGIHLNSRNSEIPKGHHGSVSCLCHTYDEVAAYKPFMKYLFLSPIFNSASPQKFSDNFTISQLRLAHDKGIIDNKVIAYGGVSTENIGMLHEFGFGGAAVYGSLTQKFNPVSSQDFKDAIAYFRLLRRASE